MKKQRKLTYWVAACLDDARAYHIRTRTRREAFVLYREAIAGGAKYAKPQKVTVEFGDVFELLHDALGEGGAHWEPDAFDFD